MFERYSESARRALFFARYETSALGRTSIEPEHLLVGLLRTSGAAADAFAAAGVTLDDVRAELERRSAAGEKVPMSLELPFSAPLKRVLEFAAREADDLRHADIGTGHLLLGLLRVDDCPAAILLRARGIHLRDMRARMQALPSPSERADASTFTTEPVRNGLVARIDRIKEMVSRLAALPTDAAASFELAQAIHEELEALKGRLG